MTTVAYAQLDVTSGELLYACAGHPPPVLLAPDQAPCFLWEGRSVPLDEPVRVEQQRPAAAVRQEGDDIAGLLTSVVREMNDDHSDDLCVLAAHRKGLA